MAYEVATAYVSIVPSMKGIQRSVASELAGIEKKSAATSGVIATKFKKGFEKAAKAGALTVGGFITGLGAIAAKGGFERALAIEGAEKKLEGMKMSASQVSGVMDNALSSVKGTAFGMGDAASVAAQLSAANVETGEALESSLKSVADVAQMSGRELTEIGSIYAKVAAKNKLQGDTMNQLMQSGIAVMPALQKHLNLTADEVQSMVSRGEIDFATFRDAMEEAFGGAALASGDSFVGAFANFKASLGRLTAGAASTVMGGFRDAFNAAIPVIDSLGEKLAPTFESIASTVGGAAVKATDFFAALVDGQISFDAEWLTGLSTGFSGLWDGIKSAATVVGPIIKNVGEQVGGLFQTVGPKLAGAVGGVARLTGVILSNKNAVKGLVGVGAGLAGIWATTKLVGFTKSIVASTVALGKNAGAWIATSLAKAKDIAQSAIIGAMYAKDLIKNIAGTTLALAKNAGQWALSTGAMVASKGAAMAMAGAQKVLNLVMSANPIGLVVTALVALGAGLVVAWKKSETFRNIVTGAWNGIKNTVSTVADFITKNVFGRLSGFVSSMSEKFTGFKTSVSGAWEGVKGKASTVSSFFTSTVKSRMVSAADGIQSSFATMRDGVAKAWDGIKSAAAKPANFVIDTVYNDSIRAGFNKVAGAVGLESLRLPRMRTISMACGGVLPGYTPGRDVHKFWSPTAGGLELSGGEGIIRPDALRALGGATWLERVNRSRGRGLATVGDVGRVQRFKDGGVWGSIKRGAVSVGSKVWDGVLTAKDFVTDVLSDPKQAISDLVLSPARGLLNRLSANMFAQIVGRVPLMVFDGIKNWFASKAEKLGGLHTKGMLGAAAKAVRARIPYVWGGSSIPPGLDCSGLVFWAFNQAGIPIPRLTAAGYQAHSVPVAAGAGKPGDLLFWGSPAHHVAINAGGGMMYEEPRPGMVARHTPIYGNPMWGRLQKFDDGGFLEPGYTRVVNRTGRPEPVFTNKQWEILANSRSDMPGELVVKDADGVLIGRMRVEAAKERQAAERRRRR